MHAPQVANSAGTGDRAAMVLLVVAVLAVHGAVAFYIGNRGWDDGAITLAFARTLAVAGKFALTPESGVVEGSSSTLWTLIFALVYRLSHPGFDAFIRASQIGAALCAAASAALLARIVRPLFDAPWLPAWLSGALFVTAPFLNETMNGMEMSLLTALALALVWTMQFDAGAGRSLCMAAVALAIALVRFEATFYVSVAVAFMAWRDRDVRAASSILIGLAIGVVGMELVRVVAFRDWLPNTFFAKRWAPYRVEAHGLQGLALRLSGWSDVFSPYALVLLPLAVMAVFPRRSGAWASIRRHPGAVFALGYVVAVVAFNLAIGRNWGYVGRMQLSAAPLMAWLLLRLARRPGAVQVHAAVWVAVMAAAVCCSMVFLQWDNVSEVRRAHAGRGMRHETTPANYRLTGSLVDGIRLRLGMSRLIFMVPDVGGTSLCCERLAIVDSALLTDRVLAHVGYAGFDAYLNLVRPDVIETHEPWSAFAGIYRSVFFKTHYRPVLTANTWLYVRDDLAARLGWPEATVSGGGSLVGVRYRGRPTDEAFVASTDGRYLPLQAHLP